MNKYIQFQNTPQIGFIDDVGVPHILWFQSYHALEREWYDNPPIKLKLSHIINSSAIYNSINSNGKYSAEYRKHITAALEQLANE